MSKYNRNISQNKHRKRRGNSRYILFFILICIVLVTSVRGITHIVRKINFFNVKRIIITGNVNLEDEFLKEITSEFIGTNLYSVPLKTVRYKYDNIVRIESIRVRRSFPNRLKLVIRERTGYVYLKTREGILVPIDRERTVLDKKFPYMNEDLPIVHIDLSKDELEEGETLKNETLDKIIAVHDLIKKSTIDDRTISDYYLNNGDLYFIELTTGSRICLGDDNYTEKLPKLEFVLDNYVLDRSTILDLRFQDQVVFRKEGR